MISKLLYTLIFDKSLKSNNIILIAEDEKSVPTMIILGSLPLWMKNESVNTKCQHWNIWKKLFDFGAPCGSKYKIGKSSIV